MINSAGISRTLGYSALNGYVAGITALYVKQKSSMVNSEEHPRSQAVSNLLKSIKAKEANTAKLSYEDRQRNTAADGISTTKEVESICDWYFSRNTSEGIRDRMSMSMCVMNILRGESMRELELPDLFTMLLENEGSKPCYAFVMIMRQGKTNQFNKLEYGSSMRNKNVKICSHGALALMFFGRFHLQGEPFPDFSSPRNWYDTKVT